jgi:hypothetical protein
MANCVYHFIDIAHLPWIIETGEKATGKSDWRLPQDPLWPTISDKADRTSTVFSRQARTLWRGESASHSEATMLLGARGSGWKPCTWPGSLPISNRNCCPT